MKLLLFIIAFCFFVACQSNQANNSVPSEGNVQANNSVPSEGNVQEHTIQELGTLSINLPAKWHRIPNDSLPQTPDMTARYWIRTGTGDTVFLVHGFSAWDLSEDSSRNYTRDLDTMFGRKAIRFSSKPGINNTIGIYVDSVGEEKQVGYYGFTAYAKGLQDASVDSFWKIVRTITLHTFK